MTDTVMTLAKYSIGTGDRFAHQAKAQLQAVLKAQKQGVLITPIWNKSFREHQIIGSNPKLTREKADAAVKSLGWTEAYFVDADHINLNNVDYFIDSCDFFTIDVADYIGKPAEPGDLDEFVKLHGKYTGMLALPGQEEKLEVNSSVIRGIASKYHFAVQQASRIYAHILQKKAGKPFIAEVSMDETDQPQKPLELFFILAGLAEAHVDVRTIAPKFSGRFNKGVDYVGSVEQFATEFEQDVQILKLAVQEFNLSPELKLSVHSGSDKFSIYPSIRKIIRKYGAGLHLKTAGTTWLEELIGLSEAGGNGLQIAKDIYRKALEKYDELCMPYASVIDIDTKKLPGVSVVQDWDGSAFAAALRHNRDDYRYNPHFRQLLHVGYKIAAQMGDTFLRALEENEEVITANVSENIFERHIRRVFLDD